MSDVRRDGWSLHYELVGPVDGPPVVLIAGSGEQIGSVEFPGEQCAQMAAAGLRVVRVDNRDNGLSLPDSDPGEPDFRAILSAVAAGVPAPLPYAFTEFSDDVVAILDDARIDQAVLVGASMGAAIARWTAIRHPGRVKALLLVMGASGAVAGEDGPAVPDESIARILPLAKRMHREEAIEWLVECWRWLWATRYPFDEDWVRRCVQSSFERSYRPEGVARNLAGSLVPGLWEAQSSIICPTVVMHGTDDPVTAPEHGRAIVSRIPHAELWEVPGMGHAMHAELWTDITKCVSQLARTA